MHRLVKYIALFLLLLFCRAMVPDALLLSLHAHGHTEHHSPGDSKQAHVSEKHSHCPVEDLFGAPYHGSVASVDFPAVEHTSTYTVCYSGNWYGTSHATSFLRGPPVA
ncbi:MAG: hypothetical protein LPK14_04785 [Hymenobacteraceae bacterium]|nr:hypothetical protein [Hymenobacteraceae bacterium]